MQPMQLLALDTATELCSVALYDGEGWSLRCVQAGNTHSQILLPMVEEILSAASIALDDLDALAFGAGPGSFTGLRIACGVVQGLAYGANLPVIGVGTLEAMAEAGGEERVIACLDARMSEVYHAAYERAPGGGWTCVSAPQVASPGAVPRMPGSGWMAAGNGFAVYPELSAACAEKLGETRPEVMPRADAIGRLALRDFALGKAVPAAEAAPFYVRSKVALTTAEREARRP
jgi:tRNA threonylcarbamoyladenosine biosynthesis protein TsaB